MAGENIAFPLPLVESGQNYAPGSLAKEIVNLQLTAEGTLKGVRGPAPLIPDYGSGYPWPDRCYGVFHTVLHNGQREVTLVRSGVQLLEQTGWNIASSTVRNIAPTPLSSDPNARFPDCFVEVAGKIVWCNGVDTPLIYDGYRILPLGYDTTPGAPSGTGPADSGHPVFRNQSGYSHPGKIGTPGNFFSVQSGALLAEDFYYFAQYEDYFGNRSPLSAAGGPVVLRQEYTQDLFWTNYANYTKATNPDSFLYPGQPLGLLAVNLDDLTRQLLVSGLAIGPVGTRARIVYRASSRNPTPRFLVRIDDNVTTVFPDNTPESGLGDAAKDYIPTPRFGIACEHAGCLYIADGRNIRRSEPEFPGTFARTMYVPLNGDPTALFSFAGNCYAATEDALFRIEEANGALVANAIPQGQGMVAPQSGDATGLGVYVGLGRYGWWAMSPDESIRTISDDIRPLFRRLTPGLLSRAVGRWNPEKREYLCAVPEAGTFGNSLLKTWDGKGWKTQRHGISYAGLCVTKDWRRYMLAAGRRTSNSENNLYALDRESGSYSAPAKTYVYRSQWLRMDALGRDRFNVDDIYIGLVETFRGQTITWRIWKNNSRDVQIASGTIQMVAPDNIDGTASGSTEVFDAAAAVLGTMRTRTPRITWKKIGARVKGVENYAFDLTSTYPLHIASFSFDAYVVDASGSRVSRQ